ncbi:uncharacterized protein LOC121921143 isoform X1 [Sceloporus undulatus]|uniref:uncharacterized protein LOC121921143 isoform X1 n=1 Tax=Sceloporus undulatus TaxID=8520 RepID=UPI001C4C23C2|nr:uncharacterized protein LOC121921143 isoform X1 [Sceloporus undulatus]
MGRHRRAWDAEGFGNPRFGACLILVSHRLTAVVTRNLLIGPNPQDAPWSTSQYVAPMLKHTPTNASSAAQWWQVKGRSILSIMGTAESLPLMTSGNMLYPSDMAALLISLHPGPF